MENHPEFNFSVQFIDNQYWYFTDVGRPIGPFNTQEDADRESTKYAFNWYEED